MGHGPVIRLQSIVSLIKLVSVLERNEGHRNWSVTGRCAHSSAVLNASICCTGASGVLGTAVFDAFTSTHTTAGDTDDRDHHAVIGLAHSRPGGDRNLHKLNLLDSDAVSTFFRDAKPNCEPLSVHFTGLSAAGGRAAGATPAPVPLRGVAVACPRVIRPSTY